MTDDDLIRMRAELWCNIVGRFFGRGFRGDYPAQMADEAVAEFAKRYPLSTERAKQE